jgi:hypothetical protein
VESRYEVNENCKLVINHAVAAKKSLDDARSSLTGTIAHTIAELQAERRPSLLLDGFNSEGSTPILITLPTFRLPGFDIDYRITQGFDGVIKLTDRNDSASSALLGKAIPTSDIPLFGVPGEDFELTIESVVIALTQLRIDLHGTGMEN